MAKATVTPAEATPSSIITDDMFASDSVIEKEVTLGDGAKRTLYFRELTAIEFKQHIAAEQSKDPKVRDNSSARLIAKSLVEPDGRRALSAARAATLKPAVSGAIFMAIMEINGVLAKRLADDLVEEDEDDLDDPSDVEEGESGN